MMQRPTGVVVRRYLRWIALTTALVRLGFAQTQEYSDDAFQNLIVQYNGARTSSQLDLSTIEHLRVMSSSDRYAAIEIEMEHTEEVMKVLATDTSIQSVEEDSIWTEQGKLEEVLDYRPRNLRRLQTEHVNYGIAMVQGDLVDVGQFPVTVCIVDTGVASGHPDLNFSLLSGVSRNSNFDNSFLQWNKDVRGHGTHTTGILNAIANNGLGIQSGMGRVPLFITRGLNDGGKAKESDILSALSQCENAGAKIVSLSLAGPYMSTAMTTKIEDLHAKGILIIAASGNDGEYKRTFPASHSAVVSVGAVTPEGQRWADSNYGPWIELVGPGYKIPSTSVNILGMPIYSKYSGTSQACPHVAGAAALVWSHFPLCSGSQIRYALAYTARGNGICNNEFGYGIVQTRAALDFLRENSCSSGTWGQAPSSDGKCSNIAKTLSRPAEAADLSWHLAWKQYSADWVSHWGG